MLSGCRQVTPAGPLHTHARRLPSETFSSGRVSDAGAPATLPYAILSTEKNED